MKASRFKPEDNPTLANRVSLRADGRLALTGYKREAREPLYLPDIDLAGCGNLLQAEDRTFIADGELFLKRKYMTTSNAKNCCCAPESS